MEYFGGGPRATTSTEGRPVANGDAFQCRVKDDMVVAAMHANDWDATDTLRDSIGQPQPSAS